MFFVRLALTITSLVLLFCWHPLLVSATCTSPSNTGVVNQPALNSSTPTSDTGSGIIPNSATTNTNNTGLLQLTINWASVNGRQVSSVSIGASEGACSSALVDNGAVSGGWLFTDSSCSSTLFGQYLWPEALYMSSCASQFTASSIGDTQTISFEVTVQWTDFIQLSRDGIEYNVTQSSQAVIPVVISYPLSISVNSSQEEVYSNSSILINAAVTAQTVENSQPYVVDFITLISRSFAISVQSSVSYVGSYSASPTSVTASTTGASDTYSDGIARVQYWQLSIDTSACSFTGQYTVDVGIYWTGTDENGTPLPSQDNPIPNNDTATLVFSLVSQDTCGTTLGGNSLSATLLSYNSAPNVGGVFLSDPFVAFFTGDVVFFQGIVTSPNLPLSQTSLTNLTYAPVSSPGSTVALVTGGTEQFAALQYIGASVGTNSSNFELTLAPSVFSIAQDHTAQYQFTATFTVTYNTGSKRHMQLRQITSSGHNAMASTTLSVSPPPATSNTGTQAATAAATTKAAAAATTKASSMTTTTVPASMVEILELTFSYCPTQQTIAAIQSRLSSALAVPVLQIVVLQAPSCNKRSSRSYVVELVVESSTGAYSTALTAQAYTALTANNNAILAGLPGAPAGAQLPTVSEQLVSLSQLKSTAPAWQHSAASTVVFFVGIFTLAVLQVVLFF